MKLKLEDKQGIKILQVLETVSPQDAAVLRAGVLKILQAQVKILVINLAAVKQIDNDSLQKVRALKDTAVGMNVRLIIISTQPGVGDAASEEAAITLANSPVAGLLDEEAFWKGKLQSAEKTKKEVEEKLKSMAGSTAELQTLRKENTTLKALIRELEHDLGIWLAQRKAEPFTGPTPLDSKRSELDGIFNKVIADQKWVS